MREPRPGRSGFKALAHVEFYLHACETLRLNRPDWNVAEGDVRDFSGEKEIPCMRADFPLNLRPEAEAFVLTDPAFA